MQKLKRETAAAPDRKRRTRSTAAKRLYPFAFMTPGMVVLTAAFFIPMAMLFVISFYSMVPGSTQIEREFTLGNYARFIDPFYLESLFITLRIAFFTAVSSLVLGYPLAYAIHRRHGAGKSILMIIVLTPLLTNVVARTLGLMIVLGRHGPVNQLLSWLGLPTLQLIPSELGIIIGLTQVFMPYMVLSISSVLENIDFSLEEAARDMGASPFSAFRKIIFPLSMPGIVAGSLFVFLLSFSSYVTPRLLGGGKVMVMTMLIYQQAMQLLNWPFGAAVAVILLIVSIVLVTSYTKMTAGISSAERTLNEEQDTIRDAGRRSGTLQRIRNRIYDGSAAVWRFFKLRMPLRYRPGRAKIAAAVGRAVPGILAGLAVVFIILPLPLVIISSFSDSRMITFPPTGFSLRWYTGILDRLEYVRSFLLSLRLAFLSMLISVTIGTSAALGLVRYSFKGREIMRSLFLSPLMLPAVIIGIALLRFLVVLRLVATFQGILAAHLVLTTAYVVRTVASNLVGFEYSLEEAARDLGAGPLLTFRKITLPLIKPGLIVAAIFAFIVSFDETTVSIFITGGRTITLPVRIFSQLEYGLDPTVTAISSLLIIFIVIIVAVIAKVFGLEKIKMR
jgi:putative spermidine/putrescine transport system permease protein